MQFNIKNYIFENIIFIIFLFTNLIFAINCKDFVIDFICQLPRYFSLYNENNILCCKEGIYTYNLNFTEQLFFHKFETEIISKNNGEFITMAQFQNNGNVIIITEDKFYLLSSEGEFLFDGDLSFQKTCSYYALVPFIYDNNDNFVIGSLNDLKQINLLFYKIDYSLEKIELIKNYVPSVITGNGAVGVNYFQGLSCQIMNYNNINILVCFCSHGYPVEIAAFRISINSDFELIDDSFTYLPLTSQANIIKSITSQDKSKCLIVFSDNDGNGYYTIYDINTSTFTDKVKYMTLRGNYASGLLVQYFPRTQEYILSSNNEKEFKIAKLDKNMNIIQNENINSESTSDFSLGTDYYGVNFYNVALLPEYENYIFIADGNYKGNTTARGYLFPDVFKPDDIYPFPLYLQNTINTNPSTTPLIDEVSSIITTLPFTSIYTSSLTINHLSTTSSSIINNIHTSSSFIHYSSSTSLSKNESNNDVACSIEFFYKNIKTNQCENICSDYEFLNNICYINDINENNIMNITEHVRKLISQIEVNKNTNIVINGNNVVYQLISSEAMDDNLDKNISIIDFGECETKLKNKFNIDFILVLKIDVFLSNSTNIVLKYEVYNPLTLDKIDLSICKDMTINTYLPYPISDEELDLYINLNESGYDLYNPNDSFYLDACTPYTTYNKTDILLSDRRTDFYKNKSFCEEGCTYKNYDYTYEKVQCECQTKNELNNNINDVKFYNNSFSSAFFTLENFSNIKVIKCVKLVFSLLGQTMNIGSYIFIVFTLIYVILIILFCKDGKKKFLEIINTFKRSQNIKMPIKKKKKNDIIKNIKKGNNKIIINKNIIINNHYRNINDKSNGKLNYDNSTRKSHSKLFNKKKSEKIQKISGK